MTQSLEKKQLDLLLLGQREIVNKSTKPIEEDMQTELHSKSENENKKSRKIGHLVNGKEGDMIGIHQTTRPFKKEKNIQAFIGSS